MSKTTRHDTPAGDPDPGRGPEPRPPSPGRGRRSELGAAGSQLSTAPREEPLARRAPRLGPIGWVRWFWRQLTSMRVALILLFLLSLARDPRLADPADQRRRRSRSPTSRTEHTTLGADLRQAPAVPRLQLGVVLRDLHPAVRLAHRLHRPAHLAVRRPAARPSAGRARAPTRLPAYTTWRTDAEPEAVREAALALLKRRRFRAHVVGDAVAAEKGYLREAGNLLFHIALIVMLVAFAWASSSSPRAAS